MANAKKVTILDTGTIPESEKIGKLIMVSSFGTVSLQFKHPRLIKRTIPVESISGTGSTFFFNHPATELAVNDNEVFYAPFSDDDTLFEWSDRLYSSRVDSAANVTRVNFVGTTISSTPVTDYSVLQLDVSFFRVFGMGAVKALQLAGDVDPNISPVIIRVTNATYDPLTKIYTVIVAPTKEETQTGFLTPTQYTPLSILAWIDRDTILTVV